jgi:hypothetical protein
VPPPWSTRASVNQRRVFDDIAHQRKQWNDAATDAGHQLRPIVVDNYVCCGSIVSTRRGRRTAVARTCQHTSHGLERVAPFNLRAHSWLPEQRNGIALISTRFPPCALLLLATRYIQCCWPLEELRVGALTQWGT